jgi:hypothetical protein
MGLTDKLPLLNSKNKIIKIVGYVLYAFVILIIIGALAPSEDKGVTASTAAEAEGTESVAPDASQGTEEPVAEVKESDALTVDEVKDMLPYGKDPVDVAVEGGDVDVVLPFGDNWNNEYILMGARTDATDIFKELFKDGRVNSVTVKMQVPLVDKYGNENTGIATTYTMTSATAAKIKWDSFNDDNLDDIADYAYIHPAMRG